MNVGKIIPNTAAILTLASIGIEAGECTLRRAKKSAKTSVVMHDIRNNTADNFLNTTSIKHNAMKNDIRNMDIFTPLYKVSGALSGAGEGFVEGMKGNLLTTGLAITTLLAGNQKIKLASSVAMGISAAWDFLKNGTNLFTQKDSIEKIM